MYVVLCYDISEGPRRGRLQRRLKRYLLPVQKSVFEGEIKPGVLDHLLGLIRRTVDMERDTVRVYILCGGCQHSTVLLGTAEPVPDDRDPLFV